MKIFAKQRIQPQVLSQHVKNIKISFMKAFKQIVQVSVSRKANRSLISVKLCVNKYPRE